MIKFRKTIFRIVLLHIRLKIKFPERVFLDIWRNLSIFSESRLKGPKNRKKIEYGNPKLNLDSRIRLGKKETSLYIKKPGLLQAEKLFSYDALYRITNFCFGHQMGGFCIRIF